MFDDTPDSNIIFSNPGRGGSSVIGKSHQGVESNQAGVIVETEPNGSFNIFKQRQADKGDAVILSTASQHDQEIPNIFRQRPIDGSDVIPI
jgi:hypothetical protein